MKAQHTFIFLSLLAMAGCFPEPLPVENIPKLEQKIVVSSQMAPDQGLIVTVTKSLGALDVGEDSDIGFVLDQIVIDDAVVTVHYDDQVDTLVNLGSGLYGSVETEWEPGITYELHVKTVDLGEVTATTQLAERVPLDDADLKLIPSNADSLLQVSYSFNDPDGKNYYVVSVQEYSSTRDPSDYLDPRIFHHLVEDREFDGEHYANNFKILWPRFHQGDTVAVFMSSVSADYFEFLKVQKENEFSLVEFISEPMNYPTNVKGGYGYFNLYLPDLRVFTLDE
jgi:hypothetical protein